MYVVFVENKKMVSALAFLYPCKILGMKNSMVSLYNSFKSSILQVKNRIGAIIQTDIPRDKGATDLARRSIYMYWNEQADIMYKDKIKAGKSSADSTSSGRLYYRNLWKDEEKIGKEKNEYNIILKCMTNFFPVCLSP